MTDSLKVAVGTSGVVATEVVNAIIPEVVNDDLGLVGQLVIIIATIVSLFKRKRENE